MVLKLKPNDKCICEPKFHINVKNSKSKIKVNHISLYGKLHHVVHLSSRYKIEK